MAKVRYSTTKINFIMNGDHLMTGLEEFHEFLINYFKNSFSNTICCQENCIIDEVIPSLISDLVNSLLTMLPSPEEVKGAGPDVFGAFFFQT